MRRTASSGVVFVLRTWPINQLRRAGDILSTNINALHAALDYRRGSQIQFPSNALGCKWPLPSRSPAILLAYFTLRLPSFSSRAFLFAMWRSLRVIAFVR